MAKTIARADDDSNYLLTENSQTLVLPYFTLSVPMYQTFDEKTR